MVKSPDAIEHTLNLRAAKGEQLDPIGVIRGGYHTLGPTPTFNNNEAVVTGSVNLLLPPGTTMISAWVTEDAGGGPNAGDAQVMTWSVQLYDGGNQARVLYGVRWNHGPLTCGISVMYG